MMKFGFLRWGLKTNRTGRERACEGGRILQSNDSNVYSKESRISKLRSIVRGYYCRHLSICFSSSSIRNEAFHTSKWFQGSPERPNQTCPSRVVRKTRLDLRQALFLHLADVFWIALRKDISKIFRDPRIRDLCIVQHRILRHVERPLAMLKMSWTLCAHGS
jgi:hypothetical protein